MGVRVKQRAFISADGGEERQLEIMKKDIVGLLLAWHSPVTIILRNSGNKKKLFIRGKGGFEDDVAMQRCLPKAPNLPLVCTILSQARCIEHSGWDDWIKTSARTPFVNVKGAISLQPAPSKQTQFMSLGLHPISAENGGNVLYDEVNRLFASSSFGNVEGMSDSENISTARRLRDRRFKQDGFTNKQLRCGGKGVDRWPMFYIRIEIQNTNRAVGNDVDVLGESVLNSLVKMLGAMILEFLGENLFRPRARTRVQKSVKSKASRDAVSTLKSLRSANSLNIRPQHQDDTFSTWSRIKIGSGVKFSGPSPAPSLIDRSASLTEGAPCAKGSQVEWVIDPQEVGDGRFKKKDGTPGDEEQTVKWTDPRSGCTVLINARTGSVIDRTAFRRPATAPSNLGRLTTQMLTARTCRSPDSDRRLRGNIICSSTPKTTDSWSNNVLKQWQNPVFETTEQAIPQVSFDGPSLDVVSVLHGRHHCCTDADIQNALTQSASLTSAKMSRQSLQTAEIISQVDQKFILIRTFVDSSIDTDQEDRTRQLLVLVDQHAADERIRVEDLLADLSSLPTILAKPLIFEIPNREQDLLQRHSPYFASWGIIYTTAATTTTPSKCKIVVKALPSPVAERCRIEPRILIDMLRGEAWNAERSGLKPRSPTTNSLSPINGNPQLSNLQSCPRPLLDMLNSRACRSAIMFNDPLTKAECETLVRRLSECKFPFQCAHGRPSMIPLVDMGGVVVDGVEQRGVGESLAFEGGDPNGSEAVGFGEAWRRWKGGRES